LKADDTILLKGSRALALEMLIEPIRKWVRELELEDLSNNRQLASA